MPSITINLPQKEYDAVSSRCSSFNAAQSASNPAWVDFTVDQYVDQQVVTPIAVVWKQEDDENAKFQMRIRYELASAQVQAQVDALLPPVP